MPDLTWPDIPGQFLTPVTADPAAVRVVLSPRSADPREGTGVAPEDHAHWDALCAANPRYHDGDILAVTHIAPDGGTIHCAPDRFMRLAVQREATASSPARDLGVRLLGVKGMIVGRDARGDEHVLIARRGPQTRIYGHQWEIAPAGGIDGTVPRALIERAKAGETIDLGERAVIDALIAEGREELGLEIDPACCRPIAMVRDDIARSIDVIIRVDWPRPIDPRRAICAASGFCAGGSAWEYTDSAWLGRVDAPGFDRRAAASIVGPMRAALRWAAWTG